MNEQLVNWRATDISSWTLAGHFPDSRLEALYRREEDRSQYQAVFKGLGIGAIAFMLGGIIDAVFVSLHGEVEISETYRVLTGLAVGLCVAFVLIAGFRRTDHTLFQLSVVLLTIVLSAANIVLVALDDITWELYNSVIIIELFLFGLVLRTMPALANVCCSILAVTSIAHGAIDAPTSDFLRGSLLILVVLTLCVNFGRNRAIAQRRAFVTQRRIEESQEELTNALGDLTSERQAVEKAAAQNIELLESMDELRQDAEQNNIFLRGIIDSIQQGIAVYDAYGHLIAWNKHFEHQVSLPPDVFGEGSLIGDMVAYAAARGDYGEGDPEDLANMVMEKIRDENGFKAHSFERVTDTGRILEVTGVPLAGGGMISTYIDVTERKHAENEALNMALHDSLTSLKNRRGLMVELRQAAEQADTHSPFALALFDLDGFKEINDKFGHPIGDQVLISVAKIISQETRNGDCVARLGGDEFAVVLASVKCRADAEIPAKRIIKRLCDPIQINGQDYNVGVSIGLGLYPSDAEDIDTLFAKVDQALYQSKNSGKGRLTTVAA